MSDERRDEDDFSHYFNATSRLSNENRELRVERDRYRQALADFLAACEGITPFNGAEANGRYYRVGDKARAALGML